jgi:hypothetical protein
MMDELSKGLRAGNRKMTGKMGQKARRGVNKPGSPYSVHPV